MTNFCIVGNGPSLFGASRGKEIDEIDWTVKFAGCRWQNPEDHGSRHDYLVTTTRNAAEVINDGIVPNQTWVYPRPGEWSEENERHWMMRLKGFRPVIIREVEHWVDRYYDLCKEVSKELKPTRGLAAIIHACSLGVTAVYLAGFDNVLSGSNEGMVDHPDVGPVDIPKTGHNYFVEKTLIPEISNFYNVPIREL